MHALFVLLFGYYQWVVRHDRPSILVFSNVVGFVKIKEFCTFKVLEGLEYVFHCSLAK